MLQKFLFRSVLTCLVATSWAAFQGRAANAADTVVVQWDNAMLQAIRITHPGPPIVARMLAVLNTCMYDAYAAYDPVAFGTRLGSGLRRPASERSSSNMDKAVSFAAYRCAVDLRPTEKPSFDALMAALGYDSSDASSSPAEPSGIGNLAAQAVIDFRHHDGANQLGDLSPVPYSDYSGYTPVNMADVISDPNRWQPLRISDGHGGSVIQKFIAPFWGEVKPFALISSRQFTPPAPALFGSERYEIQADQVINYSAQLDDRQKVIAEYWADGPASELPPGHWVLFSIFVSRRDGNNLEKDAKMFFTLSNAILDASIVSWQAKRDFDYIRPVSAIHYLKSGKKIRAWAGPGLGTQLIDGEKWQPYQAANVVTPPFPEFYSGHSVFSAAGASILNYFTGSDRFEGSYTQGKGISRVEPGITPAAPVTLHWETFSDAANEAGLSRRYGGIHFIQGDLTGRVIGRFVATQAYLKAQTYFRGEDHPEGWEQFVDALRAPRVKIEGVPINTWNLSDSHVFQTIERVLRRGLDRL